MKKKGPRKTTPIKAKIITKRKRSTVKNVPKTDPKKQRVLKNLYVSRRSGTTKRSDGIHRPPAPPASQQVWRRTIMRNKPKPKPKDKLPKLFRMDSQTGLPVDYERTVERVMHYVNPHLSSRPKAEHMLEELLANMFMEVLRKDQQAMRYMGCQAYQATRNLGCQAHHTPRHMACRHLQTMVKAHPCQLGLFCGKVQHEDQKRQSTRDANEDLNDFHSACKRGFRQITPRLGPTQEMKFNFNRLRIKSH